MNITNAITAITNTFMKTDTMIGTDAQDAIESAGVKEWQSMHLDINI